MECKYDFWGNMVVAGTDFPALPGGQSGDQRWVKQIARAASKDASIQVNPGRCDKSGRNKMKQDTGGLEAGGLPKEVCTVVSGKLVI